MVPSPAEPPAMPAVPLPVTLEEKLDDVAADVRRLRVLRGASWFAAVTFAVPILAVAADALFNLPSEVRIGLLVGWVALAVLLGWLLVVRRLSGDIPPQELAAAIEKEYPNLSERLSTLVELSEHADAGNGSKGMIAVLAAETVKRSKKMNFGKVAPTGFSLRIAGFAAAVGLLAVVPLLAVRGTADRLRRLVLPWYAPPVEVPYTLTVSSGSTVVKRGEPVTLSAYLTKNKPEAELPGEAALVYKLAGQSEERRLPMSGDEKAVFTVTRPKADEGFEYRVECGPLKSDWLTVAVVDPVEVDEAGSYVTVAPPKYAGAEASSQKWGQVKVLQHGIVTFTLKLTRVPVDVHAEWRTADAKGEGTSLNRDLTRSDDRRTVTLSVPAAATGSVKFTLFAEKGMKTEVPVAVEVEPDLPPQFDRAIGVPSEVREVKKDGTIQFDVAVSDDLAVGGLTFDYAPLNAALDTFSSEPLPIKTGGKFADGKFVVSLAGKAALGETVRVRLRATDNRSIPELNLKPNETTYPDKNWAVVRVVEHAKPLAEQDIEAQRAAAAKKLDEAAKLVDEASRRTTELKSEVAGRAKLTGAQAAEAAAARDLAQKAARLLEEFAATTARTPDTAPLAAAARKVADDPLTRAGDELRRAGTDPKQEPRDESLKQAQAKLDDAADQLAKLKKTNEDMAKLRLDKAMLDDLADELERLAREAKDAKSDRELLEAKQKELSERLAKLRAESEALKKAHAEAERQREEELATKASKLAGQERALDDARDRTAAAARREQLEELTKLQRELNKEADDRAHEGGQPLDREPFDKAEGLLDKGKPAEALTDQEKAARELNRLAEEMSKKARDRGDPKQAAEQLRKWQEDLARRTADAEKANPNGIPQTEQDKLTAEQKAIQKATDRLKLPKGDGLERLRAEASKEAGDAAEGLQKKPGDAAGAQKKAADALAKLAEQTPSNQQRRDAAKQELEKLRKEQDKLASEAKAFSEAAKGSPDDPAARKQLADKLSDQAERQQELSKKVRALDTPGAEARRDRAANAGRTAAEDLNGGLPQDIPASQDDAKRQMDRLQDALDGKTPADEKASELARLQNDLTRNLKKTTKPDELQRLQKQQQDLSREVQKLKAPDGGDALEKAQEAAKAADQAAQKPDPDELVKKGQAAAEALDKLAERLGGEAPEQKLERLAKNRQAEADKAKEAEKTRGDAARTRDAQRKAEQDLADLNDTRSGDAQAAKKKLADALDKLSKNPEADKAKDLQQQAADAARQLADAVKKKGDRGDAARLGDNPKTDPADPTDPANKLPTEQDAQALRELAKKQRDLRDDVAKAAEKGAKGDPAKPVAGDPLGDLAKEQGRVAKEAKELAEKAAAEGDSSAEAAKDAAKAADKAADAMKAGDGDGAGKDATAAADKLKEAAKAAKSADLKKQAGDLAAKEDALAKKAGEADPAAARARQEKRQAELKADADKLADALDKAAKDAEDAAAAKKFNDAADAARAAGKQMDEADRADKAGKPKDAADARQKAERKLEDAARAARGPDPKPDAKPDPNSKPADDALRDAAKGMKAAGDELKKGDGKKASDAASKAADDLRQAGEQLAAGNGKGDGKSDKPGKDGSEPSLGGGSTPGEVPSIVIENLGKNWGDLPGDVKSRITAELKAKYGDDYARVIKLYFEQLAERK